MVASVMFPSMEVQYVSILELRMLPVCLRGGQDHALVIQQLQLLWTATSVFGSSSASLKDVEVVSTKFTYCLLQLQVSEGSLVPQTFYFASIFKLSHQNKTQQSNNWHSMFS